eukprot:gene20877-25069_t
MFMARPEAVPPDSPMPTLAFPAATTAPAAATPSNVAYLKPPSTPMSIEGTDALHEILAGRKLSALFQPIIHMQSGEIIGYEGLIRGPSDSPLHAPMNLFKVARANDLTLEVEHLCRQVVLERFAELQLPGKLFLNVSPECLLLRNARHGETLEYIEHIGINPDRVIIELTENQPTYDYELMREAGYHLGRPNMVPARALPAEVVQALGRNGVAVYPQRSSLEKNGASIRKLLHRVAAVSPDKNNNEVYDIFLKEPKLMIIPVVDDGVPLGLISRFEMIDHFARPYQRELYGKKSCSLFMDANPLIADHETSLQELSYTMVQSDAHHLFNGFIITEHGRYLGMGTGHDLMREITQMQINAARYANPLTQLPGNVPINEHIDRLLHSGSRFWSEDWEARCQAMLDDFAAAILACYSTVDCERGGYISEDRQGKKVFYSLISLSLGVIKVEAHQYYTHHQIATRAAEAKKQAKKIHGNSLFLDRRQGMGAARMDA